MRRFLIALLAPLVIGGLSAPALANADTATVPVLKRPVAMGEVIDARDISMVSMRLDRIGRTVVLSRESLVGLAAKRMLNPGQPIQSGDVQRPILVPKGGAVMMLVEAPGMFLSATGKSMENGGEGDLIQVMNTQTNRTVQALVTGPNQVKVLAGVRMARPAR
jgi:flagella basal body P-ring formation protein FlgA